jgi:hypothetical protein
MQLTPSTYFALHVGAEFAYLTYNFRICISCVVDVRNSVSRGVARVIYSRVSLSAALEDKRNIKLLERE